MANVYDLLARCIDWATGKAKVEVTGSTIPDSQAVPMTQAQKDIVARAIDNIIDTIDAENIRVFLPMWETEGTKAYDLLNRDLTFTINGATLGASGPFGRCMSFDGVNDYLIQDPVTENTAGNTDLALTSATMKAATRMVAVGTKARLVRLKLKRVGTLSTATIRVAIYTDNADVPGTAVTNGTSNTLSCSRIGTSYENWGFVFSTPPSLQKNQKYWLVLEYVDGTGVDAFNYIAWQYESGANTYGERRAVFDGTNWVATVGENHVFGLWNDALALTGDFSILIFAKYTSGSVPTLINLPSIDVDFDQIMLRYYDYNLQFRVTDQSGTMSTVESTIVRNTSQLYGLTFSVAKSTDKVCAYLGSERIGTASGSANQPAKTITQPFVIGTIIRNNGNTNGFYWNGTIGPVIITSTELTAAQVAKVSHQLLALRKYGLGV